MIHSDIVLTAKPSCLQVPEDLNNNEQARNDFFVDLENFGATHTDWMSADEFSLAHVGFSDADGNWSVCFPGEYLVRWSDYPEIQVYSEQRFWEMFSVPEPEVV